MVHVKPRRTTWSARADGSSYAGDILRMQAPQGFSMRDGHVFVSTRVNSACVAANPGSSALRPHQAPALALPAALLLGLALVVELLAARQRQLDLGAALDVEIELERHQRHALALDRAHQLVDLVAMQKELARALGRMVEAAPLQVFRNRGIDQPDLPAARIRVGFGDGRLALPQRFDLGAGERDPGLEDLADLVVEARLAIMGDDAR